MPNPTTAADRAAERDRVTAAGAERGAREALNARLSLKCREYGRHATDLGGCANSGTTCLCRCHDQAKPGGEADRVRCADCGTLVRPDNPVALPAHDCTDRKDTAR